MSTYFYGFSDYVTTHLSVVIFLCFTALIAELAWYLLLEPDMIRGPVAEARKE
jgi:hypothetical protein